MVSLNGALEVDLQGQVVADTLHGAQYSGIGGHEDFVAGAALGDGRSFAALSAVDRELAGRRVSRIVRTLAAGSIVTTPRHQVDVVITEFGAAELAGVSVEERAERLARDRASRFSRRAENGRERSRDQEEVRDAQDPGRAAGVALSAARGLGAEPAFDPVLAELGAEAYPRYCASCHGLKAHG